VLCDAGPSNRCRNTLRNELKQLKQLKYEIMKSEKVELGGKMFNYYGNDGNGVLRLTDGHSHVNIMNTINNYLLLVIGRQGSSKEECDEAMSVLRSFFIRC